MTPTAGVSSFPKLTPAEDLLMDVLIARTRLGEPWWTFEYRQRPTLNRLEAKGLIWTEAAPTPHIEAHLTPLAKDLYLSNSYTPNGAKIEWGVQCGDDRQPIHYSLRSHSAAASEEYHRLYADRHSGDLYRRVVVVMAWELVPTKVT